MWLSLHSRKEQDSELDVSSSRRNDFRQFCHLERFDKSQSGNHRYQLSDKLNPLTLNNHEKPVR
ncbi:uncharacterized protein METZ01_LOCUS392712 [marine metagenome]|uniref:Uncharacterized protein n=1 Tax=marine metagenome TaxID=408172 RepID=A0A382V1M9_9ZZZZ